MQNEIGPQILVFEIWIVNFCMPSPTICIFGGDIIKTVHTGQKGVQIMCDAASVTGRNIFNIREEFNRDPKEFRHLYHGVGIHLGGKLETGHPRGYNYGEARDEGGGRRHHAASELY